MDEIIWYFLIFTARVADMSMATIRTILLVRGRKLVAAIIGFFEVLIFIVVLAKVVNNLNDPWSILAYSLGFATGNYFGGYLEEKLAIGHVSVQVISKNFADSILQTLRDQGLAVTVIRAEGREAERKILNIQLKRKESTEVLNTIMKIDPQAFTTVYDTRIAWGGFFVRKK